MSLLARLRAVDEQHVPRLAAGLRRVLGHATGVRVPPALARLDHRFAARGPLARLRRTPSLGVGLLALLLLTGGLTVADRSGDRAAAAAAGPRTALGPGAGDVVEDYLAIASARLTAAVRQGEQPATALVTLDPAVPAAWAQALPPGLQVQRAYVHGEALRAVDAAGLEGLVDAPPSPDGCPCLVALLVSGPGAALGPLAGQQGVRAVEATAAEPSQVDVRLLLPGVQGTVGEAVRVSGGRDGP